MNKKTLWILRHGDASHHAKSDDLRELTDAGREQVRRQAKFLTSKNCQLDEVWVSPYVRAQQTADELFSALPLTGKREKKVCLQPDSYLDDVVKNLLSSRVQHLMLVSHQPLVGRLIDALQYGDKQVEFMQTAALACLTADEWLAGYSTLNFIKQA